MTCRRCNNIVMPRNMLRLLPLLVLISSCTLVQCLQDNSAKVVDDDSPLGCSGGLSDSTTAVDPALEEMTYDLGDGVSRSRLVYKQPPVASFYNPPLPDTAQAVVPKFNGFAGKFINQSAEKVTLHWEQTKGGTKVPMRNHNPFTASGTATFPSHSFVFCPENDPDTVLVRFTVGKYPENLYVYDPYLVEGDPSATQANVAKLSKEHQEQYESWRQTLVYNEFYKNATGRSYLANYGRAPPMHPMWRADHIGQQHWTESLETQFVKEPPQRDLNPIVSSSQITADAPLLREYRDPGRLNLTLTVLSVAPRTFEILNFLSPLEVNHITQLAAGLSLHKSATGDVNQGEKKIEASEGTKTRTSYNSWVARNKSPILDAIYRRAADLLRIDEALLRNRGPNELPDVKHRKTLAEDLQLVNYKHKQEYTSHHDFGYSRIDKGPQGARFATLLLYLNEGMTGGETSFPRWVNAETFRELKVVPEIGKAILFYSQLPDGNLDDFSQHAAQPVTDGEKWLINLWVWDPVYN